MMFHLPNVRDGLQPLRALHAQGSAYETSATASASFCDACGSLCDNGC